MRMLILDSRPVSVGVLPLLLELLFLIPMSLLHSLSHCPQLALSLSISQHLHSTHLFLLHRPQSVFLFLLFFNHILFNELLVPFIQNDSLLLIIESLEVIRLDSVVSKHRLHGGRVLSHHIVTIRVVQFISFLISPVISLLQVLVSLFLR